jgi:hypothetical protein
MPVRRGSIEHVDLDKVSTACIAPTTITSSIRDFHLQQRRLLQERQQVEKTELPTHHHRRRRRHSYETCGTESSRRRHDTARVLDEALSLLNLGL